MDPAESSWPQARHDLRAAPNSYWEFSDIGWQRLNGLEGRTIGYRRAAEILHESMLAGRSIADLDTVFYPYALCWRHYTELQLKALLVDLRALAGRGPTAQHHHSIRKLWSACAQLLHDCMPTHDGRDTKSVGRVIEQLAAMDPDGQEFRYTERRDGTATLPDVDRVNLVAFHEAMSGVANYLEAVGAAVDDSLSVKREMDAYYAAEFGPDWSGYA